jgi:hypothetical protein
LPKPVRPIVGEKRLQLARAVEDTRYGIVLSRSDLRTDPGGGRSMDFEKLLSDASKKSPCWKAW